ncbi:MAG: hypothetical protein M3Q81_04740 [bacterium]|nr:hypothetical protein [bacterium]
MTSLGTTFTPRHAAWLGLDPLASFKDCLEWPIEYIRVGAYWDEIEPKKGQYNFAQLLPYLTSAEKSSKKIILVVGAKAPRWPEFYLPSDVTGTLETEENQQRLLDLISAVVTECGNFSCISHWQCENEPLDPSGPDELTISLEFLKREIEMIRSLDNRPIITTVWGNDLTNRGHYRTLEPLADIIGIDLYYQQFTARLLGRNYYRSPADSDETIKDCISTLSKPVWITELQAEPWEKDEDGYRSPQPKSISPELLKAYCQRAAKLGAGVVLLWGAEYWLWRNAQHDNSYLTILQELADG